MRAPSRRRRSRRCVVTVVAVAVAGLAVAGGCTADEPESTAEPVTIFGPYRDAEAVRFTADLDRWAEARGIEVRYTGTGDMAVDLQNRVAEADPPDIALVPQPGLVRSLHRDGELLPLPEAARAAAEDSMSADALELGEVDGDQVAFPFRINAKSLVWYRPEVLADLGLQPPQTLDELDALVDAVAAAGATPWCLGVEAQLATGWPATDWVEDLVLRQWGPDVYAGWVEGTVPFADPRIAESFERFRQLVLDPGRVVGGPSRVVRTAVSRSADPLFAGEDGCVLFHAPSFASSWMPSGTTVGPEADVDVFVVPSGATDDDRVVVGTDLAVAFDDRPEVAEVMAFLASPDAVRTWTAEGGFLSPTEGIAPDHYAVDTREVLRAVAEGDPDLVVDGSDAMDPAIGSDLLLGEISRWIVGATTYDELASTLDEARAASDPTAAG